MWPAGPRPAEQMGLEQQRVMTLSGETVQQAQVDVCDVEAWI